MAQSLPSSQHGCRPAGSSGQAVCHPPTHDLSHLKVLVSAVFLHPEMHNNARRWRDVGLLLLLLLLLLPLLLLLLLLLLAVALLPIPSSSP